MTNSLPADRLGIGAYVTTWGPPGKPLPRWEEMRSIGIGLEQIGVDTLWVADEPGFWEPWSILPALAAATSKVELGPLVLSTGYRPPAMVASMAESFDEVSGGRLIMGLGAGVGPTDKRWAELGFNDSTVHTDIVSTTDRVVTATLRSGEQRVIYRDGQFQLDDDD